jgi:hypothetical protein
MVLEKIRTNYKIYSIVIGALVGSIIYNYFPVDFSFSTYSLIDILNKNYFIFMLINEIKIIVLILLLGLFRKRNLFYSLFIIYESFIGVGKLVIFLRVYNIICLSGIVCIIFNIIAVFVLSDSNISKIKKILSMGLPLIGTLIEKIFCEIFL